MSKKVFKVGDRVRAIRNIASKPTKDVLGTVRVSDHQAGSFYGIEFDKNIGGHAMMELTKPEYKKGHCYFVLEKDLVKVENPSIHITVDGSKVYAVMKEGKQEVGRGVATCNPSDEFDFKIGAKLAMDRLLGEEVTEGSNDVREVSRKANVGEWIKFKSDAGNGKLLNKIGKVLEIGKYTFRVEHEKAWAQSCESRKGFEITNFSSNPLYVVLENYNPEKPVPVESAKPEEPQDEYLSFKKVKRRAKVGEFMLVVNARNVPGDDYENGDMLKCISHEGIMARYAAGSVGCKERALTDSEYVVLEGYQPPKTYDNSTDNTFTKEEVLKVVEKALEK